MKLILTFTNNKLPRVFVRILERLSAILRLFQHSFCPPPIMVGGLNLKICQNFVGTEKR